MLKHSPLIPTFNLLHAFAVSSLAMILFSRAAVASAQTLDPELSKALDALPPLAYPEPVSWWPPAIGWWLILALCLIAITGAIVYLPPYLRRTRVRKRYLTELQQITAQFDADANRQQYLTAMTLLLRRFCKHQYGQTAINTLSGKPWLAALDSAIGKPLLDNPQGLLLADIYRDPSKDDAEVQNSSAQIRALAKLIQQWIRNAPEQLSDRSIATITEQT